MVNGAALVESNLPQVTAYFCVITVISGAGAYGSLSFTLGGGYGCSFQSSNGYPFAVGRTFVFAADGYGDLNINTDSRFAGTVVDIDIYAIP